MQGKLVTHFLIDKTDSLSGPEVYELQDESGLPIWFGRHILKDVCISRQCKMINLWLFWDGAGNYLGLQISENEPLTKSDHTKFEHDDYEKLEEILRDTASILKTLKQEDLIIMPDTINPYEVDGYTAATQPGITEDVVKDAVFTCYTLWHTVYGPVQSEIFKILENRISRKYIAKMFNNHKPEYISWAIESVKKYPKYHQDFYPYILNFIGSDNSELTNHALEYFEVEFLSDTVIQHQLVQVMEDADISIQYRILWKFIRFGQVQPNVVLNLLKMYNTQKLSTGAYILILRLITAEHLNKNEQFFQILIDLSENENEYVRNLTKRKLDDIKTPIPIH